MKEAVLGSMGGEAEQGQRPRAHGRGLGFCFPGLSVRRAGDKVVPLPSTAPVPKQLHQSHRHVGCRLHPGRDAHRENALCR